MIETFSEEALADCKRTWREHPEIPGYCTLNLAGFLMTPEIQKIADEIQAEFGEVHVVNECIPSIARRHNFIGNAYVQLASSKTDPDAYVVIDTETAGLSAAVRVGSKSDIASLEEWAESLNKWAGR